MGNSRVVYLKTTESCNLSCKHCFTGGNKPPRYFWNDEKLKDWITRVTGYFKEDNFHFEFHGGEPMLIPTKRIRDMAEHIKEIRKKEDRYMSIGICTNLVYKLNDEKIDFLCNVIDGAGTSWDPSIRFANDNQFNLWKQNVKTLQNHGLDLGVMISVSKSLVDMNQEDVIKFIRDMGFSSVHFERISLQGNATENLDLFPTNKEIQKWYLEMHEATEKLNARNWFVNRTLEDVYTKFEHSVMCSGTFCRDCNETLFTVNASGSIGACPNSAPYDYFGHINQSIEDLIVSSRRLDLIVKERERNPNCYQCPVFQYCGSDCHKLEWDESAGYPTCPAPKQLMMKLKEEKNIRTEKRLKEIKEQYGDNLARIPLKYGPKKTPEQIQATHASNGISVPFPN